MRVPKPRPKALDKRERAKATRTHWRDVTRLVRARDGGKCRCCGRAGYDVHHVVMRSRGGKDEPANLVLLCKVCHLDAHQHVLRVWWADGELRWERAA